MNLTSCDECGAVIDLSKVYVPHDTHDEEGNFIEGCSEWEDGAYRPIIKCPVCKEDIVIRSMEI